MLLVINNQNDNGRWVVAYVGSRKGKVFITLRNMLVAKCIEHRLFWSCVNVINFDDDHIIQHAYDENVISYKNTL